MGRRVQLPNSQRAFFTAAPRWVCRFYEANLTLNFHLTRRERAKARKHVTNPMERFLLELRFPLYTKKVDALIKKVVKHKGCTDTSDDVIDAIWEHCSFEFSDLNINVSRDIPGQAELAANDVLTPSGREAIRAYIHEAREYAPNCSRWRVMSLRPSTPALRCQCSNNGGSKKKDEPPKSNVGNFSTNPTQRRISITGELLLYGALPKPLPSLSARNRRSSTLDSLEPLVRRVGPSPFREEFSRRLDLVERAIKAGDLQIPCSHRPS